MGNTTTKRHHPRSLSLSSSSSKRPRWEGPGLPAPPGKPLLIPGTDDTLPDVVGIRWERSPSNSGSAIVGYIVEHRRLGSSYWTRSTPGLCTFPELTLSGLEPGWRYQFRVRAQNAVGLSAPSELSDPLTVTLQRASASPPRFERELEDTVALENEQAEFMVQFNGTPFPKISWFKDGFEIFSSRRTRIVTENGKSILLIHQTALNDEGEIKCTATNRIGHVSTKAKLSLEAFPRIRLPRQYEDGLLFEQDETIRLKVSLAGRPPPTVVWFHDGEPLSQDIRHIFESMEGESVLKIPDAKRFDRGEYAVKATNKLGEDISSFLVTVTDRPAAPGKVAVTMTLGRSVTLSWKEPEDDGGCKIGTYIVEYYRLGWEVWLKAATSRQTTTTLTELLEGSEYRFRVKAENPYGVSDPSEESDVIFIPDSKKGTTTPQMGGKSQSHREISRSRAERREVSFAEPSQRSRSLTREGASTRGYQSNGRLDPVERSVSAQRLLPERPSRADSRVTFGPDTTIQVDRSEPPVPPSRSRDHSLAKQENRIESHTTLTNTTPPSMNVEATVPTRERPTSPKPTMTVTISPPVPDEFDRRSSLKDSRSRSLSMSRERSLSPLSNLKIRENRNDENVSSSQQLLRPNSILKKQTAVIDDPMAVGGRLERRGSRSMDNAPLSPISPREDDENALRGSSEFMLVLYPDDEEKDKRSMAEDNRDFIDARYSMINETEVEEDLVPPPMSLSLPELFSIDHQVVETLREAVSSTELLHERAMERFYKAVAAEEASEIVKKKEQLERKTGELAVATQPSTEATEIGATELKRSALRKRLSSSGAAGQNFLSSWQTKKSHRRSSEGQATIGYKPMKLLSPLLLPDVEARSDPNLPLEEKAEVEPPWRRNNDEEAVERLRRWHEINVPLVEETSNEKSIPWETETNEGSSTDKEIVPKDQQIEEPEEEKPETEEVEESIESSEESSEEISSADSEDLKLLKSRILARQVMEEEDTYHPMGRPIAYVQPEPTTPPDYGQQPILSAVPPSNLVPKSILKKPKEDPVPLNNINNFGRVVPPEKPIRKSPPVQRVDSEANPLDSKETSRTSDIPDAMRPAPMSESDTDSVLSAGEAAKNRRIQAKMRSATPENEVHEADIEARLAVVSHYTEIVREYSSQQHHQRPTEERKFDVSQSRSTISSESSRNRTPINDYDYDDEEKETRAINRHSSRSYERREATPREKQRPLGKSKASESFDRQERQGSQPPGSRRGSAGSRGTTPARDTRTKEKRTSRPSSRTQSPATRSRNTSTDRGASSRSSSKTRQIRAPSQDRANRPPSRTASEERPFSRERSVDRTVRRSRPPSRSNSRDRQRETTPSEAKMERLQKALESKRYRSLGRGYSDSDKDQAEGYARNHVNGEHLAVQANKTVRSAVSYVTDLTLLMAAMYVYLFKKETLAVPFIALLLYRRIQEEVHRRIGRWWFFGRKQ